MAASSAQQGRKYVELLKHKMIHVGMRLWGAVAEISAHSMVIALPHGLRGTVHYTQVRIYSILLVYMFNSFFRIFYDFILYFVPLFCIFFP